MHDFFLQIADFLVKLEQSTYPHNSSTKTSSTKSPIFSIFVQIWRVFQDSNNVEPEILDYLLQEIDSEFE